MGATSQGRCIFTFNIRDFIALAQMYPAHDGIILANQSRWTLTGLVEALHRVLTETDAADWRDCTRWLNDWKSESKIDKSFDL